MNSFQRGWRLVKTSVLCIPSLESFVLQQLRLTIFGAVASVAALFLLRED